MFGDNEGAGASAADELQKPLVFNEPEPNSVKDPVEGEPEKEKRIELGGDDPHPPATNGTEEPPEAESLPAETEEAAFDEGGKEEAPPPEEESEDLFAKRASAAKEEGANLDLDLLTNINSILQQGNQDPPPPPEPTDPPAEPTESPAEPSAEPDDPFEDPPRPDEEEKPNLDEDSDDDLGPPEIPDDLDGMRKKPHYIPGATHSRKRSSSSRGEGGRPGKKIRRDKKYDQDLKFVCETVKKHMAQCSAAKALDKEIFKRVCKRVTKQLADKWAMRPSGKKRDLRTWLGVRATKIKQLIRKSADVATD